MTASKQFLYSSLASLVFVIHLILVSVVTFGWLNGDLYLLFLGALVATVISELIYGSCLLSTWEFNLRRKIDPSKKYDASCIVHYGRKLFGLPPRIPTNTPKTFFQKYSFLMILMVLLIIATIYNLYLS